ncbi:MAG TPA: nucleotide pyrophosphatase/phosphodiesterase family protein [Propionibacteriaceae bacterium]|nr:nucleotide pyrophosphatase/phosphodiesterase family protein [Propionibacteriaceae bacterium]
MTTPGVRPRPVPADASSRSADLVRPAYGSASLGDLMPSIGAHLGVPGCREDVLGLPAADRYVVVLVDGLGWNLLRRSAREVPYLASLLGDAQAITSGVPSTTVTSLGSLGTGLVPGQHGMVGYTSRVPATGEVLNALTWESDLSARSYQPKPTFFERATTAGVAVSSVALQRFAETGLTEAVLRGAEFLGYDDDHDVAPRMALTLAGSARGPRSIVYGYERALDHQGHATGSASAEWRWELVQVDRHCEALRDALPEDVRLLITADHGMLDVPPDQRVVVEDEPQLVAGVTVLAGEPRFRQLYVDQDRPERVAERWRDRLGPNAWVRTRDEAIEDGWFGPVDDDLRERYGHVLVAMRNERAVMTRGMPRELTLVGMHGSLTADEMLVPLLID